MTYGYLNEISTQPGRRDEVVAILLGGVDGLLVAGCELYLVGVSDTEPDTVFVTEVWRSRADHDASLQLPETRAAIATAMPMLTGKFRTRALTVAGGVGLP
ncbi:putative quinol monooxygenase [Krasilnikovia sp. MM14-A1259]|uniref:putative quinol monooxygenase n=1 Tax=Krasilnikovia sp. MM14-A1259 TaxID=3373539 RepID=UPI0037F54282